MIRLHRYSLPIVCASALGFFVLAFASFLSASEAEAPRSEADSKASRPTFSVADLKADLADLYAGLEQAHFDLFVQTPKAEFDAHFEDFLAGTNEPLDPMRARIHFQRFVAKGRIGHARIDFPHADFAAFRADGGRVAPFYFRVVDGQMTVSESYVAPADSARQRTLRVGDRILAIEGRPAAAWLDRLASHVSAETDYMTHALLEFWFPQLLWAEIGGPPHLELRVRDPESGKTHDLVVALRTMDQIRRASETSQERLSLDWQAREYRMLDGGLAYLRPGPFYDPAAPDNYDPTAFVHFLDRAFEHFLDAEAADLLIDLRANAGGDNSFSDPMVAWFADRPFAFNSSFRIKISPQTTASNARRLELNPEGATSKAMAELYGDRQNGELVDYPTSRAEPRQGGRFEGRVYLLINRHSFSNAVTVAALVQDYDFGLVLGEETSDLATTYGAMERFVLPRTGIEVGYPKAHIVRPSGELALRGVVPDIAIETPLVEGPEDPVLQRAIVIIEQRRESVSTAEKASSPAPEES